MNFDKFVINIERLIESGNWPSLRKLIRDSEPVDLAVAASLIPESHCDLYLRMLLESSELEHILSEMKGEQRGQFFSRLKELPREQLGNLIRNLAIDDLVTILSDIQEEERAWVLSLKNPEEQKIIRRSLLFGESSAGRIMTTEFIAVGAKTLTGECISELRNSPGVEMIYYLFVLDEAEKFCGVASLRDVLKAGENVQIGEIMTRDVLKVEVDTDREEVARMVERYNLSAIPVVDHDGRMVGIITVDDVIDVIRQESNEDIMKLAGSSDEELVNRSAWRGFMIRMPWLLVSFFGGFLTIQSMIFFSGKLSNIIVFSFVPIIAGMGGNIGSQSSTLIVRGIALGNILEGKLLAVLMKELLTGVMLGLFFGLMLCLLSLLEFSDIPSIAFLAGGGILFSMVTSALIGALMPLVFKKCRVDPAVATGPFVTVAIDNVCLLGYLGAAYFLLG